MFRLLPNDYHNMNKEQQKMFIKERHKGAAKYAVPFGRLVRLCYMPRRWQTAMSVS
jgi:hypothetical protein